MTRIARTHRRHRSQSTQGRPGGSPAGRRRPLRLEVKGLPALQAGALVRVTPAGDRVLIAYGRTVDTYELIVGPDGARARRIGHATLPAAARELMIAPDGAVFALTEKDSCDATLLRVDGDRVVSLRTLDVRPETAVATRSFLVLSVPGSHLDGPRLVALHRRDGKVAWSEPIASARVKLRAGRHDEIMVGEGGARMRYVNTAQRAAECGPPDGSVPVPPPTVPPGRPHKPCGCPPPPCEHDGGTSVPGHRPPTPRDPNGACIPGYDVDPDDCVVTYVQDGWAVSINLCGDDRPCHARLGWPGGSVNRTRRAVAVTSKDGRRLAILDGRTLERLYEVRSPTRITALASRDSDRIFMLGAEGTLTVLDPTPILPDLSPQITSDTSSAVHMGVWPPVAYDPGGIATGGHRNVLIVPMREPGQTFNGDTKDFRDDLQIQAILERVDAFYREATYHREPDHYGMTLVFRWFGADTPSLYTGPPLVMPRNFRTYWGPAWDPGAVRGTVPVPGGGLALSFSGDETLSLRAIPSPADTFDPRVFDVRFPAASYRGRIPDALPTISFGPSMAPARTLTIDGTDRSGSPFSISVDTTALSGTTPVDLVRSTLEDNTSQQEALADVIEELLDASGSGALFERPSVIWQDDDNQAGMLHVSLSFGAAGGGSAPQVTSVNLDDLLSELGAGSRAATFALPGDESSLATYIARIVADACVRHTDFGSDLSRAYFDFIARPPTVTIEGGDVAVRINLSTRHGRMPATIEVADQSGLEKIGMDAPESIVGADTGFSGSGGPTFKDVTLHDDVYTAMIDAIIEAWGGDEDAAINEINRYFNCAGLEDLPTQCAFELIHCVVVTPVFPVVFHSGSEPDIATLRGNCNPTTMSDLKAESRSRVVQPIGANRRKIVMFITPESIDDTSRDEASAATLAHELGHGLLALPDLYSGGGLRTDVQYVDNNCLMGSSSSFSHFCAYNKRIKGWLADDAAVVIDRPDGADPVSREIVLIQLEHWDPLMDANARAVLAHSLLSGMTQGTPVVAAVFLRLGGDGRQFNVIELRGRGERFSQEISPPRIVLTNAVDPEDDTRYAETELEGAGTTWDVLEAYRRKVHLIFDGLTSDLPVPASFDFATEPEFPEVGLIVTVEEWATGSTGTSDFAVARVRVNWTRGRAIDVGFKESTPGWQSPDIVIFKPEELVDGPPEFPEDQDPETEETFRVPGPNEDPLVHQVAVRVWNVGDAEALNVQVRLVLRHPEGDGDWKSISNQEELIDLLNPSRTDPPAIVRFDWEVSSEDDTHVCFRAEIGDRDVPVNDAGVALASDDTNHHNNWAQQNVFILESVADSPPKPVEFMFQVSNTGSYIEEARLVPRGMGPGARLTVTPAVLRIAPRSRGMFRIKVELEEYLLDARCNKDITFILEAWRRDDDSEERWGGAKYVIKPRRRTETVLDGGIMFERVHLFGHVSPDVGAQRLLLHIQIPGQPSVWETITLGPAATFDFELEGEFPAGEEVLATAHFDGTVEYARSVSDTLTLSWHLEG